VSYKYVTEAGKVPASFLLGLIALLVGCGVQVPSTPVGNGDTLSCPDFENYVFAVPTTPIGSNTCAAGGCHYINYACIKSPDTCTDPRGPGGTTGGGFKVDPTAVKNVSSPYMEKNYIAANGFSDKNSPANSRLLLKPLGLAGHGGGVIFSSTDPNYLVMLTWISNRIQGPSTCP
jgi:hypothetical protein